MFEFPFGTMHELNLDWFLGEWENYKQEWADAQAGIDNALQGEIDRVEDAMTDLYDARDAAIRAKEDAETAAGSALSDATQAGNDALKSEGYALGEQDGTPVGSGSPYYQQNAKYYKVESGTYRYLSEAYAKGEMGGSPVAPGEAGYQDNAKYYKNAADADRVQTGLDAVSAAADALIAEGHAVGEQNGTPVSSGSPYYHNNAAYYAAEAQQDKEDTDLLKDAANAAALRAEGFSSGTQNGTPVGSDSVYYENNAAWYYGNTANVDGSNAQKMISASEEASSTAAYDHAAGSYFRMSGKLYQATADIEIGDTITSGTNCEEKTVGEELASQSEKIAMVFSKETVNGDTEIIVPLNVLPFANILSVGSSITGIKTTGKNIYPYGTIPPYDYAWGTSTITYAKTYGIRLPKGSYTISFTSASATNRIQFRAWSDDGTLLSGDGQGLNSAFSALYPQETGAYTRVLYWQSYRYTTAAGATATTIVLTVNSDPVWFVFCRDGGATYGDITNVQFEVGYNNPSTYEAYSETSYDATAKSVSVVPNGMIKFTSSDSASISTSVQFNLLPNEWADVIDKEFDTSETGYSVGEYCLHGNKLWRCIASQEIGSEFDYSKWIETFVMYEVDSINKGFANYKHEKDDNPFLKPFMQNSKPKLFAHAGVITADSPENTIPAYEAAGELGFYGLEADIQETSDGHFIMMHDTSVDRTTDGTGNIADMTLAQIQALHIKDHSDMTVPTLEQALAVCKMYGMIPQFEIKATVKTTSFGNLIQVFKDAGIFHYSILSGGYHALPYVRAVDNEILYLLVAQSADTRTYQEFINRAKEFPNTGVTFETTGTITQSMIEDCHDNNIPVGMFTATSASEIKTCFNNGADMVTTNGAILPVGQ